MVKSITRTIASRAIPAGITLLLLFWGVWTSVRLSRADWLFRENTNASVQRAVELDPANWRYRAWLAERLENEGADGTRRLAEAARLNPMDSQVWIRLGLNAELAGDRTEAERQLLHAASIDQLMEPRWTLMNFYFRQGDEQNFWLWAKQAFAMGYGDRTPLFDLCWRMRADPNLIEANLAGGDTDVQKQFLGFLLGKGQTAAAADVALRIAPKATTGDLPVLNDTLDRLIHLGDVGTSVGLWNALSEHGLLHIGRLDPRKGLSLVNGSFRQFPSGAGFDWRLEGGEGVSALRADPAGIRISLSGKQSDSCVLLEQLAPVEPSRRYRLKFLYQSEATNGVRVLAAGATSPELASPDWREQTLDFTSGDRGLERIAFEYRRPAGSVRAEGWLALREVRLGFAE